VNRFAIQFALAGALVAAAGPVLAAGKAKVSPEQAAYNQERARCLRGDSGQARETCLKEAGAAYDEARRGRLANAPGSDLAANATQRCQAQPPADRADCVQRIVGAGKTEGSVQGGGLIRQTETPVK
jgi:hypothetical protein